MSLMSVKISYARKIRRKALGRASLICREGGKVRKRRIFLVTYLPAKVSSLNTERPLSPGGANWSSCPIPARSEGPGETRSFREVYSKIDERADATKIW